MKFHKLVISIQNTHEELQRSAVKAVNQSLTVRNWLIGLYIVEFEQIGEDRAKYGERLLQELAESISIRGLSKTNLKLSRQFYIAYPHLVSAVKEVLENNGIQVNRIGQLLTDQLQKTGLQEFEIHQAATDELSKSKESTKINNSFLIDPTEILSKISFTHFVQLIPIHDMRKRTFYEVECIQQAWSVDELKRQINTLYYERSGISKKPDQLSKIVNQKAESLTVEDMIKSPFSFEFLGFKAKEVVYENDRRNRTGKKYIERAGNGVWEREKFIVKKRTYGQLYI